jgi:hypothetical protein
MYRRCSIFYLIPQISGRTDAGDQDVETDEKGAAGGRTEGPGGAAETESNALSGGKKAVDQAAGSESSLLKPSRNRIELCALAACLHRVRKTAPKKTGKKELLRLAKELRARELGGAGNPASKVDAPPPATASAEEQDRYWFKVIKAERARYCAAVKQSQEIQKAQKK